jgi:hypothetical protein
MYIQLYTACDYCQQLLRGTAARGPTIGSPGVENGQVRTNLIFQSAFAESQAQQK